MTASEVATGLPEHPAVTLARTGPEQMPLCVRMRVVRHGLRACLLMLLILAVIFVPLGLWLTIIAGSLEPLVSFAAIPIVLTLGFAVFLAVRARGPVLAADEHGIWLRPGLNQALAAWQPWRGIESVTVRRFLGTRYLCVKPRDPSYERWFTIRPAGSSDMKIGMRVVKYLRERRLGTNLIIQLVHPDHTEQEILGRLREMAGDRCPVD